MTSKNITRLTLFKVPEAANQQRLLALYRAMLPKATRDGKPYIVALTVGPTFEDQRSQGYTIGVVTVFESMDDFKYYDETCPAHAELKSLGKELHQGILMVYLQSVID